MTRATSTTSDLTRAGSSSGYNRPTYSARCASCTDASSAWPGSAPCSSANTRRPDPIRLVPGRTGLCRPVRCRLLRNHPSTTINRRCYLGELRVKGLTEAFIWAAQTRQLPYRSASRTTARPHTNGLTLAAMRRLAQRVLSVEYPNSGELLVLTLQTPVLVES